MAALTHPRVEDYQLALLAPGRFLQVASLRGAHASVDHFGRPKPWSGAYAAVFQMQLPNGTKRALRCPTKPFPHAAEHYKAVHAYLQSHPTDYLLEFEYVPSGVTAASVSVDVVVCDWISGVDLKEYLNRANGSVKQTLLDEWQRVVRSMVGAGVAHGDLQHENILIADTNGRVGITLVDYDSMVLPSNIGAPEHIAGVEHYQHPKRGTLTRKTAEVDRFSILVIETTLRALATSPGIWQKFNVKQANALLFDMFDFAAPSRSPAFKAVRALGGDCARLADALAHACIDPSPIATPYPWEVLGPTSSVVSSHPPQRAGGVRPLPSWMSPQGAPSPPQASSAPSWPMAARPGAIVPMPDWTVAQKISLLHPTAPSLPPGAIVHAPPSVPAPTRSQDVSPIVAASAAAGVLVLFVLLLTMC